MTNFIIGYLLVGIFFALLFDQSYGKNTKKDIRAVGFIILTFLYPIFTVVWIIKSFSGEE